MEQIKVRDLASEFELANTLVISELKKIGVWVPSKDTFLDQDIALRIRRRLQTMLDVQQEEELKAQKAKEKKKKAKRVAAKPRKAARKTIQQLGKGRRVAKKRVVADEGPRFSPLTGSLKPRKGLGSYRRIITGEEIIPGRVEVSIDDEPVIEKVEAHLSADALEALIPPAVPAPPLEAGVEPAQRDPQQLPVQEISPPAQTGETKPIGPQPPSPLAPPPRKLKIIERPSQPAVVIPAPPLPETAKETLEPGPLVKPPKPQPVRASTITLPETITVKVLSEKIGVKSKDVLRELLTRGIMANINQSLSQETAEKICEIFEITPTFVSVEEAIIEEEQVVDRDEDLVARAPVVTVMGHVDHGKTSLLDRIRRTNVVAGEAGGITQHMGAYQVDVNGKRIVFLDTPGHEAFTMMRARGARVTDIVVLVVSADDGIMPQTREAIDHARAAEVPIIVAINKVDLPSANPQRVKQQLVELDLASEDWGGETITVEVSAKEATNIDQLLEMILLMAELLELTANPHRTGMGTILEARLEKGRGVVATVLVENGTLSVGDPFVAGSFGGKVRAMFDDCGKRAKSVGPSSAVEILGVQGLPQAGDPFQAFEDAGTARQIVEYRQEQEKARDRAASSRVSLDELYGRMQSGEVKELSIVLKADAQGSAEVLRDALTKLSTEKVKIEIVHSGVGAISETDVLFASTSGAIVVGFNVRPEQNAAAAAEKNGVEIRLYTVIYEIADEIKKAMVGLLEPTLKEAYQGQAEVRQIFRTPKFGTVAGCYIRDGSVDRKSQIRLLRDNVVVHEGRLDSLRRFKDDVASVRTGYECGISISGYNDVKLGDVIEAFTREEVTPELT